MASSPSLRPLGVALLLLLHGLLLLSPARAQAQPANDRFLKAQRLTGLTGSLSGSTVKSTQEAGEPVHATTGSGHSVWYRWSAPYAMKVSFSTAGSGFDTVVAAYTGTALRNLVPVAANDNGSQGSTASLCSFVTVPGQDYAIAVDGVDNAEGDLQLSWWVQPLNDAFDDTHGLNGTAGTFAGTTSGSTLDAGETPPQGDVTGTVWFSWPSVIAGSVTFTTEGSDFDAAIGVYTGDDLGNLTFVALSDESNPLTAGRVTWNAEEGGRYRIVVGGHLGASGNLVLNWKQELPPPANNDFTAALVLNGFTGQVEGSNGGATLEPGEPVHATNGAAASVWYSWIAPRDGVARFDTSRSLFPAALAVYTGDTLDALQVVVRSTDGPPSEIAEIQFQAHAGTQYWLALDGQDSAEGFFVIQWTYADLLTPNNPFDNPQPIDGFLGRVTGENFHADTEPGEPFHAGDPGGRSIWYVWTAPGSYRVEFTTQGSNFDTLLAVYTGDDLIAGLSLVAANDDDANSQLTSEVIFDAVAGRTYRIAVDASTEGGMRPPEVGMVVLSWQSTLPNFIGLIPAQAAVGAFVRICGPGLADAQSVAFGGVDASFFFQGDYLVALVPPAAADGPVSVLDAGGNLRYSNDAFTVLLSAPPTLSLQLLPGNSLRLSWPSTATGYVLQSSSTLSPPFWRNEEDPKKVGAEWVVVEQVHPDQRGRYYRLLAP